MYLTPHQHGDRVRKMNLTSQHGDGAGKMYLTSHKHGDRVRKMYLTSQHGDGAGKMYLTSPQHGDGVRKKYRNPSPTLGMDCENVEATVRYHEATVLRVNLAMHGRGGELLQP